MGIVAFRLNIKLLKLIKLIYYIEKDGTAKSDKCSDGNVRILITDVLQKPRLENVITEYSEKSVYGEYFEDMFSNVKSQVPDADKRIKKIEEMNAYWEYITNIVFLYFLLISHNLLCLDIKQCILDLVL